MSFEQLGLIALGLYLVALLSVAEIARRARRDASRIGTTRSFFGICEPMMQNSCT